MKATEQLTKWKPNIVKKKKIKITRNGSLNFSHARENNMRIYLWIFDNLIHIEILVFWVWQQINVGI